MDLLDAFARQGVKIKKKEKPKTTKKRRLKQAKQTADNKVEILCKTCRLSKENLKQTSITSFFSQPKKKKRKLNNGKVAGLSKANIQKENQKEENMGTMDKINHQQNTNEESQTSDQLFCNRCLAPLTVKEFKLAKPNSYKTCPFKIKLKRYKKMAEDSGVDFILTDREACAIMREKCVFCHEKPHIEVGNGITRLNVWPADMTRGKGMGPYTKENTAPACTTCNLMKNTRGLDSYIEFCKHISTFRSFGDFGSFPERFRNNISKRSRSSYINKTKTHSITNEEFNEITSQPCHYCGKKSDPPRHHNGLDRLDSSKRVYTVEAVVSCCGDCNTGKYRFTEEVFLQKCLKVAKENQSSPTINEN